MGIFEANSFTGAASGAFLACKARQCLTFILLAFGFAFFAHAQLPTQEMPPMSPELEMRLKKLETELRCLVCQNQTLAESPAGLAGDLRREIRMLADQNLRSPVYVWISMTPEGKPNGRPHVTRRHRA